MLGTKQHNWLQSKGYIHCTAQIDVNRRKQEFISKITNQNFVAKHAFYPLIHTNIYERKYKKISSNGSCRAHSYKDDKGKLQRTEKSRPLHYAANVDAMIFAYYAEQLQSQYEQHIKQFEGLADCIIAYRKIPYTKEKNKGTIHFANEIFAEIKGRAGRDHMCMVLTFDIKSFFSTLDHTLLKKSWSNLLKVKKLSDDHYNVFKASTQFSYIYLDELRISEKDKGRKFGFDEKLLANIRNLYGINAFFESPKVFRDKVKDGTLRLYKYPFRNKFKEPIGIPQGLPISAVLANLYLLDFDKVVLEKIVNQSGGYYRRYSDDIVIICSCNQAAEIETFIKAALETSKMQLSENKTEKFIFKDIVFGKKPPRLASIKLTENGERIGAPFNYLGFEFNGQKALIKSANIAKFYRRMISAVKRKARRAKKVADKTFGQTPAVYRRQLYKLYTSKPLHNVKLHKRWKKIIKVESGEYRLTTGIKKKEMRSNYFTYVKRASEIMHEPSIVKQLRKHKRIFNQAIYRHLNK